MKLGDGSVVGGVGGALPINLALTGLAGGETVGLGSEISMSSGTVGGSSGVGGPLEGGVERDNLGVMVSPSSVASRYNRSDASRASSSSFVRWPR